MLSKASIFEIPQARYASVAGLFRDSWFDEAHIEAVLEGRQPAHIFVDAVGAPQVALMCRTYDFYLAGRPEKDSLLRRFLLDAPSEAGVFAGLSGYCPIGKPWEDALIADHGSRLAVIPRRNFCYRRQVPPDSTPRLCTPAGVTIVPIDDVLVGRIDRELGQQIGLMWDGYEAFRTMGFGYAALDGDIIASVVYPAAVSSRYADINIETEAGYRRRGLGVMVSIAFIQECLARGLTPLWDSDASNRASVNLARHLGFEEEAPFTEFAPADRSGPVLSHGIWTAEPSAEWPGVTRWRRA